MDSSVKLNLGENEDDQEEEEEEEDEIQEEEPIIEESLADNDGEEDAEMSNVIKKDEQEKNEATKPQQQITTIDQKGSDLKKTNAGKEATSKFQASPDILSTESHPIHKNNDAKTIFTKVSEELFHKLVRSQSNDNHMFATVSTYDMIVNDMFLNRLADKVDKGDSKFKDFYERNENFQKNKILKLKERAEKIASEINSKCYGIPNGKAIDKSERRTAEEFFKDNMKYWQNRELNIKQQRENILKVTKSEMKDAPQISEKSKQIAISKRHENAEKEVHQRLQKEKLKVQKQRLFKEAATSDKAHVAVHPAKKTKQGIQQLVDKLYTEANTMKKTKEKAQNDKQINKEMNNVYHSDDDLTTQSTKKILLEKFVKHYEKNICDLFNKKYSVLLSRDDFYSLLYQLGCVKFNHNHPKEASSTQLKENSNPRTTENKEKKELALLTETWKMLAGQSGKDQIEERIDSNQLLIFFLAVLGIYKGEESPEDAMNNEKVSKEKETMNSGEALVETQSKSKTIGNKNQQKDQRKIFLIQMHLTELDCSKYFFMKKTVKRIKAQFRYYYDNIMSGWAEETKQKKREKFQQVSKMTNISSEKSQKELEKFKKSIENYQSRIYKEIESEENLRQSTSEEQKRRKIKIEEVYSILKKRKENEIAKLKVKKEEEEMKACTFQPNIFKGVTKDARKCIEQLYLQGKAKNQQRRASEESKTVNVESTDFTFKPQIIDCNSKMFEVNPLLKDESVQKERERFEQARFMKKVTEFQKKKGITTLKQSQNITSLIKEEDFPDMKFSIEKKFWKDTFDNFEQQDRASRSLTKSDYKQTSESKAIGNGKEPLLNIEVNIDDKSNILKIEIFQGDNPVKIAEDFCRKHGISSEKKLRLQQIIQEKLAEANMEMQQ